MIKKLLYIFIFILFSTFVYSSGTCTLDKSEYVVGEMATVSCVCTGAAEENQPGYFVWMKNDSIIQKAAATNSGSCISGIFGDSYTIVEGGYPGNVSFALNADGTGIPVGWTNPTGDIRTVNYTVAPQNATPKGACIVVPENLNYTETGIKIDLGRLATMNSFVYDAITQDTLMEASCNVQVFDGFGKTLMIEPYANNGIGEGAVRSNGLGKVIFSHQMDEAFWKVDQTYILEINCYCTPNGTDKQCWITNSSRSEIAGYKACEYEMIFTTGKDYRKPKEASLFAIVFVCTILMLYFSLVGWYNLKISDPEKMDYWIGFTCFALGIIELFFMVGLIYLYYSDGEIVTLLSINFWAMALPAFMLGFISMYRIIIRIFYPEDIHKKWD